jgi:hypothetical protein
MYHRCGCQVLQSETASPLTWSFSLPAPFNVFSDLPRRFSTAMREQVLKLRCFAT